MKMAVAHPARRVEALQESKRQLRAKIPSVRRTSHWLYSVTTSVIFHPRSVGIGRRIGRETSRQKMAGKIIREAIGVSAEIATVR